MKNSGRAARSSLISSVCVVVNIVLNALLIFGLLGFPEMDAAGAAAATAIARAVELTWAYVDSLAGNLTRARQCGDRIAILSICSGAVTGAVLLLISPVILHLANLTPDAQRYLKWMLVICAYYIIGKSVNSTTVGGIFCAGGDSRFGLVCDSVTLWCVTVPLGLLAAFVWRLPVYFIVNLDEMIKLPAVYRHYRQYKWVKNLTGGNEDESD